MKTAETYSCSLCNNLYTYLCHHIVVLDKFIHSNLVYYKHNGDDEPSESSLRFVFKGLNICVICQRGAIKPKDLNFYVLKLFLS